ncbi:MAG: Gp49 family protein [bacterium]|nr:Gp49 family protein [bacterium]
MHNITAPANDDASIERLIQSKGKVAARVTPVDIAKAIVAEHYFTAAEGAGAKYHPATPILIEAVRATEYGDEVLMEWDNACKNEDAKHRGPLELLTFCVLVLANGFTVTGESACASPENFDAEIGRRIARENAVQKLWPLLGFELKSRLAAG